MNNNSTAGISVCPEATSLGWDMEAGLDKNLFSERHHWTDTSGTQTVFLLIAMKRLGCSLGAFDNCEESRTGV